MTKFKNISQLQSVVDASQSQTSKIEDIRKKKKTILLCRSFMLTGTCRQKQNCSYAHSLKEIYSEYKPQSWKQHFPKEIMSRPVSSKVVQSRGGHSAIPQTVGTKEKVNMDKVVDMKGQTQLIRAILDNKEPSVVVSLVKQSCDPQKRDWTNNDSIMYLVRSGRTSLLEQVLSNCQSDLNLNRKFFRHQLSYLIVAAKFENLSVMSLLLRHGANVNSVDAYGRSALFYSVIVQNIQSVHLLISHDANLNLQDDNATTSMDLAFKTKNKDIIQTIFSNGAIFSNNLLKTQILFFAIEKKDYSLIKEAFRKGISYDTTDKQGNNILMLCQINKIEDFIFQLIENFQLSYLINKVNNNKDSLLSKSMKEKQTSLVTKLVNKYKINVQFLDNKNQTLLMLACIHGLHEIIAALLKMGIQQDAQDKKGKTALILAVQYDHFYCVQELLKYNRLDTTILDHQGNNARHYSKHDYIKKMISNFMIENKQLDASLTREIQDDN